MDFGNERPSYPIKPPAFIRHLSFRLRAEDNPNSPGEDRPPVADPKAGPRAATIVPPPEPAETEAERRARISAHVSGHLNRMRRHYDAGAGEIRVCENDQEGHPGIRCYPSGSSALIQVVAGDLSRQLGFRLRVRFDFYSEAFSLTYIFDRFKPELLKGPERQIADFLARLQEDDVDVGPHSDALWNSEEIGAAVAIREWLAGPSLAHSRPGGGPAGHHDCDSDRIADFRTIVICPTADWKTDEATLASVALATAGASSINPALTDYVVRNPDVIKAIASPGEFKTSSRRGGESVMCGMLGGDALFVAELAKWGGEKDRGTEPIHSLVIYAGHSQAQIGRLVRRCHILGELRHLALLDFDDSRQNGAGAGNSENDLKSVDRELLLLEQWVTNITVNLSQANMRSVDINPIVGRWAQISKRCEGGLIYRVEKSRYYATEFLNTLDQLRVVRVGDWQPYDDFVRRYILQRFARIDRIGNRYTAMGERMSRLMAFKQASTLEDYQADVQEALRTLGHGIGEMKKSTAQVHETTREQVYLLQEARYFAFIFIAYYLGSVLSHNFPEGADTATITLFQVERTITFNGVWTSVTLILVTITIGILVRNGVRRHLTKRRERFEALDAPS